MSIAVQPFTAETVVIHPLPSLDRLVAALCVVMLMFYAATVPAKAVDQVRHTPTTMIAHDHSGPADFAINAVPGSHDDHAEHFGDAPADEESGKPFAGGHHHHHGDSGPNLLVPDAATARTMSSSARLHAFDKDRHIAGLRSIGPERPPRFTSLTL